MFVHSWGSYGSADGRFANPIGVVVSASGIILVADSGNHRIQCFRTNGEFVRKWGTRGRGDGQFDAPTAVALGVYDGANLSLLHALNQIPQVADFPPGIAAVCAVYVGNERLYVVDTGNHRLQVFETEGQYRRKWGSRGEAVGQFKYPRGCCVDNKKDVVYVADTHNHRIQVFDKDGQFVRQWCGGGVGDGRFDCPMSVSVSGGGLIYVIYTIVPRVVRYHHDGTLEDEWSDLMDSPCGVVVDDERGVAYVTVADCILQCRLRDGVVLQEFGSRGMDSYHSIAKGWDGMFYLTDCHHAQVVAIQMHQL